MNNNANSTTAGMVTEKTTLGELITILGDAQKEEKVPTPKKLRENAGEPIGMAEGCVVYSNGYAVYDNGSGRTVVWVPDCTSFTYRFNSCKDTEKGGDIKNTLSLDEGVLESLAWPIVITLIGEHRVEANMDNRMGSRVGTRDFCSEEYGDKDGDVEDAVEMSYRNEYFWKEDRFGENPEAAYIRNEELEEALSTMTEKQREVFCLYYRYGYTQQEIGERLGLARTSVMHRLEGAVKKMKKIYRG